MARIVEHKTGKSWASVREEMDRLQIGKFIVDTKQICQLTEMTKEQAEILQKLELKEPSSIVDIRQ